MAMTPVVHPHHLSRKAVIYIRQSTGHQVLTNTESQQLQHTMREHARQLGWPEERIEVVETDLGRSAHSTQRRDGYKVLCKIKSFRLPWYTPAHRMLEGPVWS